MEKQDFIKWARKLQSTYAPNEKVQAELAVVDFVAIVGPTGAGKTTIIEKLGIQGVVSDVTRMMRTGEKNGRDYNFRDDYLQMLQEIKNGEYVQFLISKSDEFYGTRKTAYPNSGKCTMAVFADVIDKFNTLGFHKVHRFYIMPPGYVEWMRRVGAHDSVDLSNRFAEAKQSLKLAMHDESYTFILNDDLNFAIADILATLNGETVDPHRTKLAYDTAGILLERLGDTEDGF